MLHFKILSIEQKVRRLCVTWGLAVGVKGLHPPSTHASLELLMVVNFNSPTPLGALSSLLQQAWLLVSQKQLKKKLYEV